MITHAVFGRIRSEVANEKTVLGMKQSYIKNEDKLFWEWEFRRNESYDFFFFAKQNLSLYSQTYHREEQM